MFTYLLTFLFLFLVAIALSLSLDPTFGIHYHEIVDSAQPCRLLKT